MFGENQGGAIKRVSREEIREIAQQASSSSQEGRRGDWSTGRPFNLFEKAPTHSNQHGKLHDVDSSDYSALRDQNISVSFATIRGVSSYLLISASFSLYSSISHLSVFFFF